MPSKQQNQNQPSSSMMTFELKRAIVGALSLACLLMAGLIYAASPDLNNVVLASSLRIGVVLFATWLALPQLRGIMVKLPDFVPIIGIVLIILCAVRPNLFRVVSSLIIAATALVGISTWIRRITGKE